jgi:Pycsar effector protein
MRFRRNEAPPPPEPVRRAVEFAWRVHAAQETWTAKVDAKAAIVLSLETAILVVLLAAQAPHRLLGQLTGWRSTFAGLAIGLFIMAMVFAAVAVIPLLGPTKKHRAEYDRNVIYFGHLRHWRHEDLNQWLGRMNQDDELTQLSRQLIELSRRNWQKHRSL